MLAFIILVELSILFSHIVFTDKGVKYIPDYGKYGIKNRQGNIRIVTVKVLGCEREYSYLAGVASYYENDLIEVPFGKNDDIRVAVVIGTYFVTEEELPVPLYKMKYAGAILNIDPIRQFENHMP